MSEVAFLGLGVMGYPMAGHLKARGHGIVVYNRTAAKAQKWVAEHGGASAPTPREAARGRDFVFACVGNDDDLRAVALGPDGAFAGMKPGAVFVDHTTASADVARELSREASRLGLSFVDAPVSGGQAGAENGTLTVMCGGDEAAYAEGGAGDRVLRARLPPDGRRRRRTIDQDGQSALHRRPGAGARRGPAFRRARRSRPAARDRRHLQGRGAILADGQPPQDDDRRQVRLRLRRRLDAQGPGDLPGRSAAQRRAVCPSRRWSINSIPTSRRWAAGAGTLRA